MPETNLIKLVEARRHDSTVDDAIVLSKSEQHRLGQLPYEAFHRAADRGTLLVAYVAKEAVGYVLYRTVRRRSYAPVLTHLCVNATHRGEGVARRLVDEVVARNPMAPGVSAWCREDYEATNAWPRLGFDRTADRPGNNRDGIRLLHWWRPIEDRSLLTFSAEIDMLPAAAIDTNIYRDIYEPRPERQDSIAVTDSWVADAVDLVLTGQTQTEIHEAAESVDGLASALNSLKHLTPAPAEYEPILVALRADLDTEPIEESDLRMMAQAAAGGARYFVTHDGPIVRNATIVEQSTGLQVLRPADLLLRIHADSGETNYRAAVLAETRLHTRRLTETPSPAELVPFTNHDAGERSRVLAAKLRALVADVSDGSQILAIEDEGQQQVALAAIEPRPDRHVALIRVAAHIKDKETYARQLLHHIRVQVHHDGTDQMSVAGDQPAYMARALLEEGFNEAGDRWIAYCRGGELGPDDLAPPPYSDRQLKDLLPIEVSLLERKYWPAKFYSGNVATYLLPVAPQWARALFGNEPGQQSFLPRPDHLGLAREHVYYKSYRKTIESPARLVWYVSGGGSNGGIRAISWLEGHAAGRPRSLFRTYGTQGIYNATDIDGLVSPSRPRATALVFSRTEILPRHLPLAQLRELYSRHGQTVALRTMTSIGEHVFAQIYREGNS